ncbi:hypothetical protein BDF19DRAFT_422086 [Syncephalis fuscata]|nr:hypothetical protein BDF19DRAFT_422086 [Syncephalis fuscata]
MATDVNNLKDEANDGNNTEDPVTVKLISAEARTEILQQVCEYLEFKHKYRDHTENIPEFHIDLEDALELLIAADYLDSK